MIASLAAWFHDLDPFLVRFSGDVGIRWYGLAYIAGFVVAYLLLLRLAAKRLILIPRERIADAMMWLVAGTLIGGRTAYVLIYDRSLLTDFSGNFPFWGVFAINRGGMASHGGIVGVILAAWRISRGWKTPDGRVAGRAPLLHVLDVMALICPFGLMFGRLANFINGELLGKVVTPAGVEGPWWSVQFPKELVHYKLNLDTEKMLQLHALVAREYPTLPFEIGLDRMVENAGRYAAELKPLLTSRHPSQLYQAAAEGVVLAAVLWLIWARPRKPGVVGAWFLIAYGLMRITTEFWRLPDLQFVTDEFKSGRPYGLSMGQWLSVAMVIAGAIMLAVVTRRTSAKLGGWLNREPSPRPDGTMPTNP